MISSAASPAADASGITAVARRAGARVGPGLLARQEIGGDHGAQREPAPHALADGHDVGDDAFVVGAPHGARPAEAAQHLVDDQQGAVLARDGLDRSQEPVGRHHVARGALDRLHDDGRDLTGRLVPDDVAHVVGARNAAIRIAQAERAAIAVAVRGQVLPGHERSQMMLEVAAQQAEHAAGLPVKATPETEHLVLPGRGLRQPERGFHRLGSTREHLDASESLRRERRQQIEESRPGLGGEAPERQALDLPFQRLDVVRVAVADATDTDAGNEVDVRLAILVVEHRAGATRHRDSRVLREGLKPRRHVALLLLDDLPRSRARLAQLHYRSPRKRRQR